VVGYGYWQMVVVWLCQITNPTRPMRSPFYHLAMGALGVKSIRLLAAQARYGISRAFHKVITTGRIPFREHDMSISVTRSEWRL